MRILMVNLTDWSGLSGGVQQQFGLFEAFVGAGHDVRMITRGADDCPAMPYGMREAAVIVGSLTRAGLPVSFDTLAQLPTLVSEILRFRPDMVHAQVGALSVALAAVCKLLGTRLVLDHGAWLESQRRAVGGSRLLAGFERLSQIGAARLADGSRCLTEGLRDRLAEAGVASSRLAAIGNGTDCGHFHPIPRAEALAQFGLPAERSYIGFIGTVTPRQGLATALDGFAKLAGEFPDADLLILGDGPGLAPLRAQAKRLGLSDRLRTSGRVPYTEANTAINCFDLAILPLSRRHDAGFGASAIKLRDYAAAGRVVLTGAVPGNIERAGESWLLTHVPDDADDFASALTLWLESRQGDAGHWDIARARARQYALRKFTWARVADEIVAFATGLDQPRQATAAVGRLDATALRL